MKEELTLKGKVEEAVNAVKAGMLENIEASKAEIDAKTRKNKAYYKLLKAKERLRAIEQELMTENQDWKSEVSGTHERIKGYIPKKKKDHSKTIFWIVMGIIGLPFLYVGIISLIDIIYG